MRKLIGVLSFTAAMLGGSTAFAQAQGFGKSGTAALGAERLFGFYKLRLHVEAPNGNEEDFDYTGFGFGWGAGLGTFGSPFEVPRVGFDYFIIDSLSIGGALGYASFEDDDNDEDFSAFLFAPRVGYFIGLSDLFGFWPRGGFSYHSKSPEGNNDESGLALTLEAYFTLTPVEHFGFMFGPTLDLDFMGERECGGPNNSEDCKHRYRSIGLVQVGMFGWF